MSNSSQPGYYSYNAVLRCCINIQHYLIAQNFLFKLVLSKSINKVRLDPLIASPFLWLFLIGSSTDGMKTFFCLWIYSWLKHCVAFKSLSQRWITEPLLLPPILVSVGLLSARSPSCKLEGTETTHPVVVQGVCTGTRLFSLVFAIQFLKQGIWDSSQQWFSLCVIQ